MEGTILRSCATHIDVAEQEACATALGYLKDSSSIKRLKKLSSSPSENVQLAALRSLYSLGDDTVKEKIFEKAKEKNTFAITMLGDITGSEETLLSILQDENLSIRFNAALSLLKRKDPRVVPYLREFLIKDSRDLGFQPQTSLGNSLKTWKVISSMQQHAKESYYDLLALGLSVREHILRDALELPEEAFIKVARLALDTKQNELIPLLVSLLENIRTPAAIDLLKTKSQTAGAPLIRAYCNLALFRLKEIGPYEENVKKWVLSNQSKEIIQFRPSLPWAARLSESNFDLTPEESSSLLIESYQVLAEKHDEKSIEFLLSALEEGENKNIPVLAGILLRALQ
jgi:HEAT repeat protein